MINAGKSHTGKLSAALASTTAFLRGLNNLLEPKLWQVAIHFLFVTCLGSPSGIGVWYLEIFWPK